MVKTLYFKLALQNIRKNARFYLPYLITSTLTTTMFYNMVMISTNKGLSELRGSESVSLIMRLGTTVVGIFAAVFLFYTNSFLMKRRKKEFGLYNILGMEKKHIMHIMFWETVCSAIVTLLIGISAGIILSKLVFSILLKMIGAEVPYGFEISFHAVGVTAALITAIFFVILLFNTVSVIKTKPIELLKGGNFGEKEPKIKWILTVVGLLSTGIGYYIAITTESPLDALLFFFLAVLLVILGTYCLFIAGSIALLKLLRKNNKYYYNKKHFTSVSGMLYRMKQNAVGLANICILCTMVLVMISSTVSLYIGFDDAINSMYNADIVVKTHNLDNQKNKKVYSDVIDITAECGRTIKNKVDYSYLFFGIGKTEKGYTNTKIDNPTANDALYLYLLDKNDYRRITGEQLDLKDNEIAVLNTYNIGDAPYIVDKQYKVTEIIKKSPEDGKYEGQMVGINYIVVSDMSVLRDVEKAQMSAYGDDASEISYYVSIDIDGTDEQKIECADKIRNRLSTDGYIECRQQYRETIYTGFACFLFLGIYLGLLFLMATALIIYYKQISEGYEDKERFEIMQKVGMSRAEVKGSIRSQVLTVFFLPLAVSVIHIAAAFKMISRLLVLFNLYNDGLFAICTVVTVLVFAAIYAIIYSLTAKTYYKIVQ